MLLLLGAVRSSHTNLCSILCYTTHCSKQWQKVHSYRSPPSHAKYKCGEKQTHKKHEDKIEITLPLSRPSRDSVYLGWRCWCLFASKYLCWQKMKDGRAERCVLANVVVDAQYFFHFCCSISLSFRIVHYISDCVCAQWKINGGWFCCYNSNSLSHILLYYFLSRFFCFHFFCAFVTIFSLLSVCAFRFAWVKKKSFNTGGAEYYAVGTHCLGRSFLPLRERRKTKCIHFRQKWICRFLCKSSPFRNDGRKIPRQSKEFSTHFFFSQGIRSQRTR